MQLADRLLWRSHPTKLQIMSDLHLEVGQQYAKFHIEPRAPYLVLAGDIGRLNDYALYLDFVSLQCDQFLQVFLVLGNHEFFGITRQEGLRLAVELQASPRTKGRLNILNRTRCDLETSRGTVTILGCTLQSNIPPEAEDIVNLKVADFRKIVDWGIADHVAEHKLDIQWLEGEIDDIVRQGAKRPNSIVVITHHAPSTKGTSSPQDEGNPWSSAFGTDLLGSGNTSSLNRVNYWISGHTHYSTELRKGTVKLTSNQRGYVLPGKDSHHVIDDGFMRTRMQKIWGADRQVRNPFNVNKVIYV